MKMVTTMKFNMDAAIFTLLVTTFAVTVHFPVTQGQLEGQTAGQPDEPMEIDYCPDGSVIPYPCSEYLNYKKTYYPTSLLGQKYLSSTFEKLNEYSISLGNSSEPSNVAQIQQCSRLMLTNGCAIFYPNCDLTKQKCVSKSFPVIKSCLEHFPVFNQISEMKIQRLVEQVEPQVADCKGDGLHQSVGAPPLKLDPYFRAHPTELQNTMFSSFHENNLCAQSELFIYFNDSKVCSPRCDREVYYSNADKKMAFTWLCIWTSLCIIACGFTVLTYFLKCERFCYPERPVIYMSCSCLLFAFGHLLRQFTGVAGVACLEIARSDETYTSFYVRESLDGPVWCTFTFMLIYYSQMAIHVWWLILSFSWFLSAVLQWSPEALEDNSVYFHLVAWFAPACKMLVIILTKRFDGDPLTGLCLVGAQSPLNLAIFIIIPISIYLSVGLLLTLFGFLSLMRIRSQLRLDPNLKKMDMLIIRIGLFAVCYIIPCILYLLTCLIEYEQMQHWTQKAMLSKDSRPENSGESIANTHLMLFKHSMTFFIGIATSIWMFNAKTLDTWRECFCHTYGTSNHSPYNQVKPISPLSSIESPPKHEFYKNNTNKLDFVGNKAIVVRPNPQKPQKPKPDSGHMSRPVKKQRPETLLLKNTPTPVSECYTDSTVTRSRSHTHSTSKRSRKSSCSSLSKPDTPGKATGKATAGVKTCKALNPNMPIAVYV